MGADDETSAAYLGLESVTAQCPWCGEVVEWVVDSTATDAYGEDCYVCCRPCVLRPQRDEVGQVCGLDIDCE